PATHHRAAHSPDVTPGPAVGPGRWRPRPRRAGRAGPKPRAAPRAALSRRVSADPGGYPNPMVAAPAPILDDRYAIIREVGAGGMGRVWLGRDRVLGREVAIKELVPPPGLDDKERERMRLRSLREARAIARLSNRHIVRIFDVVGTDTDPWIVMEY